MKTNSPVIIFLHKVRLEELFIAKKKYNTGLIFHNHKYKDLKRMGHMEIII